MIKEFVKRISGKAVAEPRRQSNWDFPIKEIYYASSSVYTEQEAQSTIQALAFVPIEEVTA